MTSIDLNCDMGESYGAWKMGRDEELLDYVSSANVACGFHAGDPTTIRRTIEMALEKGVAVGAHPSYPDLQGFGRRSMSMPASEVFDIILYQTAALKGICESLGGRLSHVKPHGALYNQAAKDPELAAAISQAVFSLDPRLVLYGRSGSRLITEAARARLRTAFEVFADRTYQADGSLTPRSVPGALIEDTEQAVSQVMQMIGRGTVRALTGGSVEIRADTVCIHGDGEHAAAFARAIHSSLIQNGVGISAIEC